MAANDLKEEWCLQQTQFDNYEKHSLLIKLMSVAVTCIACFSAGTGSLTAGAIIAILWLQDAIWKTFQSRIETRLLRIEQALAKGNDLAPFQFNSEFIQQRQNLTGLIREYLGQAARPTIAYPHAALMFVVMLDYLFASN